MARSLSRHAGVTLIEVLAGVVIFGVVIAVALQSSLVAGRVNATIVSSSELDVQVHRVLDQVARELVQARAETLTPDPTPPFGASALTYERAELDGVGGIAWSTPRRLEFQQAPGDPLDGLDNDGNGIVDDGEIWLVTDVGLPTEERALLARHVAGLLQGESENLLDDNANGLADERGLSFETHDGVLIVRVSLQAKGPDGPLETRTAETAIRPRN